MNKDQQRLAMALIAACESDELTQANAKHYGDWLSHLMDELADELRVNNLIREAL